MNAQRWPPCLALKAGHRFRLVTGVCFLGVWLGERMRERALRHWVLGLGSFAGRPMNREWMTGASFVGGSDVKPFFILAV